MSLAVQTISGANLDFQQERGDLACAFRWTARLNMNEGVANHFSLAVDDAGQRFLINPAGKHFSRIKASDLIVVDALDPASIDRPDAPDRTAWALHGAVHRQAPHARCIVHVHSKYATVLATLKDPTIPPIDQNTMRFYERIAVDTGYDGMGLGDEAERVAALVGDKPVLVMGNHGVMIFAPTVAHAFDELYYFERACETYITALMTGQPLAIASHEVASKTRDQWVEVLDDAFLHMSELHGILSDEGSNYLS